MKEKGDTGYRQEENTSQPHDSRPREIGSRNGFVQWKTFHGTSLVGQIVGLIPVKW